MQPTMSSPALHIVADGHIWHAESAFTTFAGFQVDLTIVEQGQIGAAMVRDADVLLVRSSTKVNEALLSGSRVNFVATATVGDDHIDRAFLAQRGIAFASAAGSSTGSVVEYLTAALVALQSQYDIPLSQQILGVVGVGRIGSAVAVRAQALGMTLLCNDPPLAAEGDNAYDWCSLNDLLEQADILTLHTPLVRTGNHPSFHLLDREALARFQGRVIINAARGAVLDNQAVLAWLSASAAHRLVLDCWEHEPCIDRALLVHPQVVIATPHIAGHSLDGKAANTQAVYDALCDYLAVDGGWRAANELPPAVTVDWPLDVRLNAWDQVAAMIHHLYPLENDVSACRNLIKYDDDSSFAAAFKGYRRHYPVRRSWQQTVFRLPPLEPEVAELADRAGLVVASRE
ncbi:MAG: 4-phosphoerythronate dehydrogenase [Mariprofundales bacterium]